MSRKLNALIALLATTLMLSLAGTVMAQSQSKLKINPSSNGVKRAEGSTAQTETDPKIVKGLEAAAAARGKTKGKVVASGDSGLVIALFEDAGKLSMDEVNRGAEVGVIYVGKGSKELPAGYYYVKLSQHVESGKDAGTAKPMHDITLIDVEPGSSAASSGNATGRRQYRPIVLRKDVSKSTPSEEAGSELLNTTTLGGDILAAVEQSIINTTKSNVKEH